MVQTFITRAELAQRWGISLSTINKWSQISPEKLPPQAKLCGCWRFRLDDVIDFETKQLILNHGDNKNGGSKK